MSEIVPQPSRSWFNCEYPIVVRNKYTHELLSVPCGKCHACRVRKVLRNVPDIINESYAHKYTIFFTLTYSNKFLPKINVLRYESPTDNQSFKNLCLLSKDYLEMCDFNLPVCSSSDVQRFVKRLRQHISRSLSPEINFRYIISYDFGSTGFRPHYHGALFFNSDLLHENISDFISRSWSVYDRQRGVYEPIGRIDVQDAFNCAKYIASYVQAIPDLPLIYTHRDFRARALHSSSPSFGSCRVTLESPEKILRSGSTTITVYDVTTSTWKTQPLSRSDLYRLFPTIPTFGRINKNERLSIYRKFRKLSGFSRYERFELIHRFCSFDSFLNDYLTLGQKLSADQLLSKIDHVFYTVERLYFNADTYGYSISDYDNLIADFYSKRKELSLHFHFNYEKFYSQSYPQDIVDSIIDPLSVGNHRGLSKFLSLSPRKLDPCQVDSNYFHKMGEISNRLVKTKLNNAWLDEHPEFKQFHKSNL